MSAEPARAAVLAWLASTRGPGGSWGYTPGSAPALEPTLLAAALAPEPELGWIAAQPASWATWMLPLALRHAASAGPLIGVSLKALLAHEGERVEATAGSFRGDLAGWAWVPGTFSWVEPTAWAVASRRAAGLGEHPRAREGLEVLADRQCADGGWNSGNPDMLGAELPGSPYLTGLVLLALPPGHPSVPAALRFLAGAGREASPLALSTALLGLAAHGHDDPGRRDALIAHIAADGSVAGRADRAAWAAHALDPAQSPLVLR